MSRKISEATKKRIAGRQLYKCANAPNSKLPGLEKYSCPLWQINKRNGCFDEAGYEIDHIVERCISNNNNNNNLQALCAACHSYKTRGFKMNRNRSTTNNAEYNKIIQSIRDDFIIDMNNMIANACFNYTNV